MINTNYDFYINNLNNKLNDYLVKTNNKETQKFFNDLYESIKKEFNNEKFNFENLEKIQILHDKLSNQNFQKIDTVKKISSVLNHIQTEQKIIQKLTLQEMFEQLQFFSLKHKEIQSKTNSKIKESLSLSNAEIESFTKKFGNLCHFINYWESHNRLFSEDHRFDLKYYYLLQNLLVRLNSNHPIFTSALKLLNENFLKFEEFDGSFIENTPAKKAFYPGPSAGKNPEEKKVIIEKLMLTRSQLSIIGGQQVELTTIDNKTIFGMYNGRNEFLSFLKRYGCKPLTLRTDTNFQFQALSFFNEAEAKICISKLEDSGFFSSGWKIKKFEIAEAGKKGFILKKEQFFIVNNEVEEILKNDKSSVISIEPSEFSKDAAGAVLLFGGNKDRFEYNKRQIAAFLIRGFDVMTFNYRGFEGDSQKTNHHGVILDGEAAYQYLKSRTNLPDNKIIFKGLCFGTGPATTLGKFHSDVNLWLDEAYSDFSDLASDNIKKSFPIAAWIAKKWAPDFKVSKDIKKNYGCKLFTIASEDEIVSKQHLMNNLDALIEENFDTRKLKVIIFPGQHCTKWYDIQKEGKHDGQGTLLAFEQVDDFFKLSNLYSPLLQTFVIVNKPFENSVENDPLDDLASLEEIACSDELEEANDFLNEILSSGKQLLKNLKENPPQSVLEFLKALKDLENEFENTTTIYGYLEENSKDREDAKNLYEKIQEKILEIHGEIVEIVGQQFKPNPKIPGDGNCLFHSIGDNIGKNQKDLRKIAADYIRINKDLFRDAVIDLQQNPSSSKQVLQSIDSFCNQKGGQDAWGAELAVKLKRKPDIIDFYTDCLENSSVWGGSSEIQALSAALKKPIFLFAPSTNKKLDITLICGLEHFEENPVLLYYNGVDHYQSLVKKSK